MEARASVAQLNSDLYIESMEQAGFGWRNSAPYVRASTGDSDEGIGALIRQALDASAGPRPATREPRPFLEWSGLKSWNEFDKRSLVAAVSLDGGDIVLEPFQADRKGSLTPLVDQTTRVPASLTDAELGRAVRETLSRSVPAPTR
jgi:hypothetical protein